MKHSNILLFDDAKIFNKINLIDDSINLQEDFTNINV
jgi:hypothetical protein